MKATKLLSRAMGSAAVVVSLVLPPHLQAGDTFTATVTGTNGTTPSTQNWNNPAIWTNDTATTPGTYPGSLNGAGTPVLDDTAIVHFRSNGATDIPQLDLNAMNLTLEELRFTEDPTPTFNADGNFVSTGGNAKLTLKVVNYQSGNREIDFQNVDVEDVADGQALQVNAANGIDFGAVGISSYIGGSDGIVITGSSNVTMRDYRVAGNITVNAAAGLMRFGINTVASGNTLNVPTLTLSDPDTLQHFYRSNGSGLVSVNIGSINAMTATNVRIGGTSAADGTEETTVNINSNLVYGAAGTMSFINASNYGGVVNLNGNIRSLQTPGTPELFQFLGDGVTNVNADMQDLAGVLRTGNVRIDGARGLIVGVNAQSRLGSGNIEVRSGSGLRFSYDVFADGYVGSAITGFGGVSNTDTTGGAAMEFATVQSGFYDYVTGNKSAPLTVKSYNAIAGNLTNAVYTGPGANIVFENNAVLGPVTGGSAPTRADLGGAILWQAITDNAGVYTDIGDDGVSSIFKGVAFSPLLLNGANAGAANDHSPGFHGTLTARSGMDLNVLVASTTRVSRLNSTIPTFNSGTGVANFYGSGELEFEAPGSGGIAGWNGTVTTINRIGDDGSSGINSQNLYILRLDNLDALASGRRINVTHGRVSLDDDSVVNNNAELHLGAGATVDFGSTVTTFTRGDIFLEAGSAVYRNGTVNINPGTGSTWTVTPGTMLILDGDLDISNAFLQNTLMPNMNIVINDADADIFSGATLKIGQDMRLTTPSSTSIDFQAGSIGITNAAGANRVLMTAAAGRTLDLQNTLSLSGVTLQIGDTNSFETIVGGTTVNVTRTTVAQNGTVRLGGQSVVGSIEVLGGRLLTTESTGDTLNVEGDLIIDALNVTSAHEFQNGDVTVGGNIIINPSGGNPADSDSSLLKVNADDSAQLLARLTAGTLANGADGVRIHNYGQFHIEFLDGGDDGSPTPVALTATNTVAQKITIANDGESLEASRVLMITGTGTGNVFANLTNVHLLAGSNLRVDLLGTGDRASAGLTLHGDATVSESTSSNADDFDLGSIVSSTNGQARTLYVGQTTATASDATQFATRLRGAVSGDVTLDLVNANMTADLNDPNVALGNNVIIRGGSTLNVEVASVGSPIHTITSNILVDNAIQSGTVSLGTLRSAGQASGTAQVSFANVTLTDGSLLMINENTGATARVTLKLMGEATLADTTSTTPDDYDLDGVASDVTGQGRTLIVGRTGGAADDLFSTVLRGVSTADVTLDLVNSAFTISRSLGGDVQGDVIVRALSTLTVNGGAETISNLTVFGVVNFAAGGSLIVDGELSGNGSVAGVRIASGGSISPGASPDVLTIAGNLILDANTSLNFELGDDLVPASSDRIDVTGLLDLSAGDVTLNLAALAGFGEGDYVLFNYGSITGSESAITLGAAPAGYDYTIEFTNLLGAGQVLLHVATTVIPEPATLSLLALGGLLLRRRR